MFHRAGFRFWLLTHLLLLLPSAGMLHVRTVCSSGRRTEAVWGDDLLDHGDGSWWFLDCELDIEWDLEIFDAQGPPRYDSSWVELFSTNPTTPLVLYRNSASFRAPLVLSIQNTTSAWS
ncbi:hypothetical protein PM082_002219 [Marasmius tenuissimus]|nr:hypothetical protein PM082_002219 [Marasmius tenuissimus]